MIIIEKTFQPSVVVSDSGMGSAMDSHSGVHCVCIPPTTCTILPFSLPWWFRIVAWVLLWTVTLVCVVFVTFYGISFADEKCRKWLSSFFISLFTSVLLTQPIKVCISLSLAT